LLINFEALISMENLRHFLLLCLELRPYYLKIEYMLTIYTIEIDRKRESLIKKRLRKQNYGITNVQLYKRN
jgi:hypothetical protein